MKAMMNMDRFTEWFEKYEGPRMSPTGMLLVANACFIVLVIVLYGFGKFPFHTGDFLFLSFLFFLFSLYRPAWAFLSFVAVLPIEIVNVAPSVLPMNLRPYQLFGALLTIALSVLFARRSFSLKSIRLDRIDIFPFLIVIGGFLGAAAAPLPHAALKQAVIVLSFGLLYLLGRIFIRSEDDMCMALRYLLVSSVLVAAYAIFQNLRFLGGGVSFETMPGRPNGTFPEPDWLGMYLVPFGAMLFSIGQMFAHKREDGSRSIPMVWHPILFIVFTLYFSVLLMTVARSAWLGVAAVFLVSMATFVCRERRVRAPLMHLTATTGAFLLALALVVIVPLTRFDLLGRAGSVGNGLQQITVACDSQDTMLPATLHSMIELSDNGCRQIDLEAIAAEKATGKSIMTISRPDPSTDIRREIYAKSFGEIRNHPLLGIGWGSMSAILGMDENGHALNASNMFLDVWLGSGLLGLIGLLGFLGTILVRTALSFRAEHGLGSAFILSAFVGLVVVNLFNAGLLQGYVWILFAMGAMIATRKIE